MPLYPPLVTSSGQVVVSRSGLPFCNELVATIAYIPISVTNSATIATSTLFQQYITVDLSGASQYINPDLSNLSIVDSAFATLASWRESGTTNTGNASWWVLIPSGIPASSEIGLAVMINTSGGTVVDGVTTGISPVVAQQLGLAYGTDDNGANIFEQYGGKSWSSFSFYGGTWTTVNGYLQQTSASSTQAGLGGEPSAFITSVEYSASGQYVLGMAFNYTTEADARLGITAVGTPTTGTFSPAVGYRFIGQQSSNGAGFISFLNDSIAWVVNNTYQGAVSTPYTMVISNNSGTWSGLLYSGYAENGATLTSLAPIYYATLNKLGETSGFVGISAGYYDSSVKNVIPNPINVMWFYLRQLPPSGTMPSVTVSPPAIYYATLTNF
jgi:hypothetical protein